MNVKKKNPRVLPRLKTIIIEKSDVTAPLWRYRTYENLTLQGPKSTCELPGLKFPKSCPEYPKRSDFIEYLDEYENKLKNKPHFNTQVTKAEYSEADRRWKITTQKQAPETKTEAVYSCDFLAVATGLNAQPIIPHDLPGLETYFPPDPMKRIHSSNYKNGTMYRDKKVLVVGCGDSGIDICGDLHNAGATPYIVVNRLKDVNDDTSVSERSKKFYAKNVNETTNWPLKTNLSELSEDLGNRGKCGKGNINKDCDIQVDVCSNIVSFHQGSVKLLGRHDNLDIDCVILATGYNNNVNDWLNVCSDAKVKFNDTGDLQFDDAAGDNWLEGKEITFDEPGDLQGDKIIDDVVGNNITDDALDDTQSFKRRIRAIGFDYIRGLHALKTNVKNLYDEIQKE